MQYNVGTMTAQLQCCTLQYSTVHAAVTSGSLHACHHTMGKDIHKQPHWPHTMSSCCTMLCIMLCYAVHHAVPCLCPALQLQQLFPDSQDWDSIQALVTATHLLKGTASPDSGSSDSSIAGGEGPAAGWAAFYSHPHAWLVLLVLSCWMPESLAAGFLRTHEVRGGKQK